MHFSTTLAQKIVLTLLNNEFVSKIWIPPPSVLMLKIRQYFCKKYVWNAGWGGGKSWVLAKSSNGIHAQSKFLFYFLVWNIFVNAA